jgi:hypothetical protein
MNLRGRSLLKEIDLTADEFRYLVDLAKHLRMEKRIGERSSTGQSVPPGSDLGPYRGTVRRRDRGRLTEHRVV